MIPIQFDKEETVLVTGNFSGEDIKALHANPTLLSAKVSYIRSTIVNLYVKGYTTYVFTSNGLFELLVACIVNDFNKKGLAVSSVFINGYPGLRHRGARHPEEFAHISVCFSESAEDYDPLAMSAYLAASLDCMLSPSRIRKNDGYFIPESPVVRERVNALN